VSFSWNDALARLGGAFAVSLGLHLSAALALEALPWAAPGAGRGAPERGAARMQAAIRYAPPPATPVPAPASIESPQAAAPPAPAGPAAAEKPSASDAARGQPGAPAPYFASRDLDVRPTVVGRVDPPYPNDAYLREIAGRVVVRLFISEKGTVEKAATLLAEPPGYFEEAVERAFLAARFNPGMKGGRPVKVQLVVEVRYDSPQPTLPGGESAGREAPQ
jgi:protein TonB